MVNSETRSPHAIGIFLLAGFAAVYLLPYLFTVQPTVSESYLVGFNNRACVIFFVAFLGAFAWWSNGLQLNAPAYAVGQERDSLARGPLYWALGIYAVFMGGEWLFVRHHAAVGEAIYFLDRLQQLTAGKRPYVDFEFAYGPLLLYFPAMLAKVLHVALSDAFYAAWIIEFLLGIALFWTACRMLPVLPVRKDFIFFISVLTWWAGPFSLGENYTPLRFVLAPLCCLMMLPRVSSSAFGLGAALFGVAAEAILLLISPEQAIAFVVATILYVVCFRLSEGGAFARFLPGFAAGSAILFWLANRYGLLLAIRMMGNGGYNFPLLPVMQHVPLFGLLAVAVCALVRSLRGKAGGGAVEYLTLLSLTLLPAALGRSDPGHIVINSTGGILAGWVVLAPHPVWWKRAAKAFVWLAIALPAPIAVYHFVHSQRMRPAVALRAPKPSDPQAGALLAPFGIPIVNNLPSGIPYVDDGYYHGLELVTQSSQVEQKMRELDALPRRDLFLPGGFSCAFEYNPKFFRHVLLTPLVPPARRSVTLYKPLCDAIHLRYHPDASLTTPYLGYEVWAPNP